MNRLQVATKSAEKLRARWSNKPAKDQPFRAMLGNLAVRMGQMLRTIHADGNLRQALQGQGNDSCPAWIIDLMKLEPLTSGTAEEWFSVGWAALVDAANGDVTSIPDVAAVGERVGHRQLVAHRGDYEGFPTVDDYEAWVVQDVEASR